MTFIGLVDDTHTVSSLYNLVNVPSTVWIDEQGQVRRIDEGSYATKHTMNEFEFGRSDYAPMVASWVKDGNDSPHLKSDITIAPKTAEQAAADPAFMLGSYFQSIGQQDKANHYWALAQSLNPDSWNYHRQDWAYTPEQAGSNWQKKVQTLGDKPYYKPIEGLDANGQGSD